MFPSTSLTERIWRRLPLPLMNSSPLTQRGSNPDSSTMKRLFVSCVLGLGLACGGWAAHAQTAPAADKPAVTAVADAPAVVAATPAPAARRCR
jgi:hypothetical protein